MEKRHYRDDMGMHFCALPHRYYLRVANGTFNLRAMNPQRHASQPALVLYAAAGIPSES